MLSSDAKGYDGYTQFSKIFKKYMEMSPNAYRMSIRKHANSKRIRKKINFYEIKNGLALMHKSVFYTFLRASINPSMSSTIYALPIIH